LPRHPGDRRHELGRHRLSRSPRSHMSRMQLIPHPHRTELQDTVPGRRCSREAHAALSEGKARHHALAPMLTAVRALASVDTMAAVSSASPGGHPQEHPEGRGLLVPAPVATPLLGRQDTARPQATAASMATQVLPDFSWRKAWSPLHPMRRMPVPLPAEALHRTGSAHRPRSCH